MSCAPEKNESQEPNEPAVIESLKSLDMNAKDSAQLSNNVKDTGDDKGKNHWVIKTDWLVFSSPSNYYSIIAKNNIFKVIRVAHIVNVQIRQKGARNVMQSVYQNYSVILYVRKLLIRRNLLLILKKIMKT